MLRWTKKRAIPEANETVLHSVNEAKSKGIPDVRLTIHIKAADEAQKTRHFKF